MDGIGFRKITDPQLIRWLRKRGYKPWSELTEAEKKDWLSGGHPSVHKNDEFGWFMVRNGKVGRFGGFI
jgi:hypothetical protein